MMLIKCFLGHLKTLHFLDRIFIEFSKKKTNLIISYFLVYLTRNVLLILWGFLRNESYGKQSSTNFNRNKHKRIKGHNYGDARPVREIPVNDATKVYMCPTVNCRTSS